MNYEMIDDCICELNDEPCYVDCEQCPYFFDCMDISKLSKKEIEKILDKQ